MRHHSNAYLICQRMPLVKKLTFFLFISQRWKVNVIFRKGKSYNSISQQKHSHLPHRLWLGKLWVQIPGRKKDILTWGVYLRGVFIISISHDITPTTSSSSSSRPPPIYSPTSPIQVVHTTHAPMHHAMHDPCTDSCTAQPARHHIPNPTPLTSRHRNYMILLLVFDKTLW